LPESRNFLHMTNSLRIWLASIRQSGSFMGPQWGHQHYRRAGKRSCVRAGGASAPGSENAVHRGLRKLAAERGTLVSGLGGPVGRYRSPRRPARSVVGYVFEADTRRLDDRHLGRVSDAATCPS